MLSAYQLTALAAAVGSGVIAGVCFAFASFLMRALDALGATQAIRAMQAVNATILRSSTMAVWFGTVAVGAAAAILGDGRGLPVVAAVLYAVGALLITGRGNVPLNEELDRVEPESAGAEAAWQHYRLRWGRWNALRTAVCASASLAFALAI